MRSESRMYSAIKRFLSRMHDAGRFLILLDDMDQASPETVNLVTYLLDGLSDLLVVVGPAARPEFFGNIPRLWCDEQSACAAAAESALRRRKLQLIGSIVGAGTEELPSWVVSHRQQFSESTPRAMVEFCVCSSKPRCCRGSRVMGIARLCRCGTKKAQSSGASVVAAGVVEARLRAMAEARVGCSNTRRSRGETFILARF